MLKNWLKITVLAVLSLLLVLGFSTTQASAKRHYVTTPTNMRGIWYQYDKQTKTFAVMKMTKYTWYNKSSDGISQTISGKRFFDSHQYSCQLISEKYNDHGYWSLGQNQSSLYVLLKRTTTTHNGKKYVVLRQYIKYPQARFTTWTHHKFK